MPSPAKITALASLVMVDLYRRRDLLVAFILAAVILVPLASWNVFGVQGTVRYLQEVALLLIWIFSIIIGLGTAARVLSQEMDARTIYPLLAKPVRRSEVLLGKALGAFTATASATVLFYAAYLVLCLVKSGAPHWCTFAQAVLLHIAFIGLLTALVVTGSLLLTPSANMTCCALITAGMLLFGERLPRMADAAPALSGTIIYTAHALLPHFEFFDLRLRLVHAWEPVAWWVVAAVCAYALCAGAALLGLGIHLFNRKKI